MAEFSPIITGLRPRRTRVSAFTFLNRPQEKPRDDYRTTLALQQNRIAFESINSSIATLSAQVSALNTSLIGIAQEVKQTSALDQAREAQKQRQEQILAEQQLREGKESVVERKMQTSLLAPVRKVGAKAQFTLSRLGNFFMVLLGGFLGNMAIQTLGALISGDKEKLEELKKKFFDNIGIVSGLFLLFSGGFGTILGSISRLTATLGGALFKNLLLRPVNALLGLVKSGAALLPGATRSGQRNGNNAGTPAKPSKSTKPSAKPRGFAGGGIFKRLPVLAGTIQGISDIFSGESIGRTGAGLVGMGGLGLATSFLNPYAGLAVFLLGSGSASNFAKDIYEQSGLEQQFPELGTNITDVKGGIFNIFQNMAGSQVDIQRNNNQQMPDLVSTDSQGNVTVINTESQSGGGSVVAPQRDLGRANYLPNIPSSNPDNFYVMYSRVQYNVIG